MQDNSADNTRGTVITSRFLAISVMVLTSILMSFSGVLVRNIEHAGPWQINIYRSLAFIISILVICFLQNRNHKSRRIKFLEKPTLWAGMCLGLTGVAFTQALTTTSIANSMFIMSAIPLLTMVLAYIFLKEIISFSTFVAIGIAGIGIVIMVVDGLATASAYGNLMAILTAFGFAGFTVILRGNQNIDMLPSLILGGLVVMFISIFPILGSSNISFHISTHDLLLCILWGAGLSGMAHWAIVAASRFLYAAELTLFMLFEFAMGPLWVWQFVGETPSTTALIGGVIVILSVAVKMFFDLRTNS